MSGYCNAPPCVSLLKLQKVHAARDASGYVASQGDSRQSSIRDANAAIAGGMPYSHAFAAARHPVDKLIVLDPALRDAISGRLRAFIGM